MLFGLACTKSWESCRYDIGGSWLWNDLLIAILNGK
jgi:hypothetical protein